MLIVMNVDVVKVRLMNDKHREFSGVFHCVKNVLTHEGPLAFYKGFGMCWARVRVALTTRRTVDLQSRLTAGYTYHRQFPRI